MYQLSGRNPFASGGSTKRLYEVGRVGFNTVVDQTLLRGHARKMKSSDSTAEERCVKRFKNTCGDTVGPEVSGSIVPQEPLYICMGHNGQNAPHATYDNKGRPLNTVKACHVTSSLNHLQITYKDRLAQLQNYNRNSYDENNTARWFGSTALEESGTNFPGNNPSKSNLFVPRAKNGQNRPGMRFLEDLAIYRQLTPTFVGFASGSYDAPSTLEATKKPPHLAANCGGLMTVQASSFYHKRGSEHCTTGAMCRMRDDGVRGIEIGERLCITFPREDWHNQQCGVPNQKTTLVVCDAHRAQMEHRRNYEAIKGDNALVVGEVNPIVSVNPDDNRDVSEYAALSGKNDNDSIDQINRRVNFIYDSYMTRPLEIGQCRSGCRQEGQMIDMKYDLVAPNIGDLILFGYDQII